MFVVRLSGSLGRAGAVRVGCSSIAAGCRCRSTQPPPLYTTTSIRLPGGVEAPTFTTPSPPAETEDADNSSNTTIKTRSKQQRHLVLIPSPSLVCDSSEWLPAATSLFEKKEVDDYGSLAVTTLPLPGFGTAGEFAPDTPTAEWYTAWIANALARISEASDDGDVEIDVVAAGHSAGTSTYSYMEGLAVLLSGHHYHLMPPERCCLLQMSPPLALAPALALVLWRR